MSSNEEIIFKKPGTIVEEVENKNKNEIKDKKPESIAKVNTDKPEEIVTESKTVLPEPLTKLLPPDGQYFLDQLKNGTIIEHKSMVKSRIVFGRARDCDVILEHPSVSRYHAILLWSPLDDNDYQNGTKIID